MSIERITSTPLSHAVWQDKYRAVDADGGAPEASIEETWVRVAAAAAQAENRSEQADWQHRFYEAMSDFAFLPGGRILAGAGLKRERTLFNCFVMNRIDDDMSAIFENLREAALTMQSGGGIGMDFSTLRPRGARVHGVGAEASGPVSFMQVWDAMCATIQSAGARRGAMMAVLRVDHPDIEEFIDAKSKAGHLSNFNLSVLISDAFMRAVDNDADWPLQFGGETFRTVGARDLFERIMQATYDQAEPGVVFIDRINHGNKLSYCESIYATNPCGEQPLPPYGACMLGSINLPQLVLQAFGDDARLDEERLQRLTGIAVRFLDNIIDISYYPLPQQQKEALAKRRIGLGITGLADALVMCGVRYGSARAQKLAGRWMKLVQNAAYDMSATLAASKGSFPLYDGQKHLRMVGMERLEPEIMARVEANGLRNGLLTSIAPTGTISLLAGNVSGGVEPIFDLSYSRGMRQQSGEIEQIQVEDYAYRLFQEKNGPQAQLPAAFVTAQELSPLDHLNMQAALQPHVDSAISKTVNCPEDISREAFRSIYQDAYRLGLKGCTTFRPNPITGSILLSDGQGGQQSGDLVASATVAGVAPAEKHREDNEVVYMADPLERGGALSGYTYKLKWPDSEHAIYITINDVVHNDRRRPFEIFINSKNLEHYAWTVALTRMISAVFRRGGDVSFVVEELKAVFDPRGGQWMNGHYVPSLLAAIGEVVEKHLLDTGFMIAEQPPRRQEDGGDQDGQGQKLNEDQGRKVAKYCPKCGQPALVFQEGCHCCNHCGYSKCS